MKHSALLRVAPIALLALLGSTVCLLVACGQLSDDDGANASDELNCRSNPQACSDRGYGGYGGYGYR